MGCGGAVTTMQSITAAICVPEHKPYEDTPQSLRTPVFASKSAYPDVIRWLIDWLAEGCLYFFPFFLENHLGFRLHFCSIRSMITMPIGGLKLAELGRVVSGKCRFLKCADFEAYPRTQSINQPSNNMGVRRLWSKNGVRRLWGISSYSINQSTIE